MRQRRKNGQFAKGNTIGRKGWQGLVRRRFDGDTAAARAYVAQLGFHTYARMALEGTPNAHKLDYPNYAHPGTPEQYHATWRQRLDFDLSHVGEVQF